MANSVRQGRLWRGSLLATLVTSSVVLAMANPVVADAESPADRINRALSEAGVILETGTPPVTTDAVVHISDAHPSVSIATNRGTAGITVIGSGAGRSEQTRDGWAYGDVAPYTDAHVRRVDGGAQILTVMRSPRAPSTQRYHLDLPSGIEILATGNGFTLVEPNGIAKGSIAAPWAKDATGRTLPTRYSLEGNVLVQQTDVSGAHYPVVADPKITYGLGVYLNMWGHEIGSYATAIIAVFGLGVAIACTQISRIPNAALRTLAMLVCGAAAINLRSVFQTIVDTWRNTSIDPRACYQDKIWGPGSSGGYRAVGASNCS